MSLIAKRSTPKTTPRSVWFAALGCAWLSGVSGCTVDVHVILPGIGSDAGDTTTEGTSLGDSGGDGDEGSEPLLPDDGAALDFGSDPELSERVCQVAQLDAPLPCNRATTSAVIEPKVAWTWTGPNGEDSVIVTPLVANLDDDNHDGAIDLCDVPDILVLAVDLPPGNNSAIPPGHLYVLDSRTGTTKFVIDHPIDATTTPAIADLDADGFPEIIALERSSMVVPGQLGERRVVVFDHTGALVWVSDTIVWSQAGGAIAVADLDADGSPEILAPEHVLSADGELLWAPPDPPVADSVPLAVDLDLDGQLEVLFGSSVYDHSGALLFELMLPGGKNIGVAAVANFDEDPYPEIYVQAGVHRILEHDGSPKAQCNGGAGRPVAIRDLDGDGQAEILVTQGPWFSALRLAGDHCVTVWSSMIDDANPRASGTAFDLLGDGRQNPIFADLGAVRIFDEFGVVIAEIERTARSTSANPVVADVDNDGAAELVLVGSEPLGGDGRQPRPSVLLVENVDDAFAPTRRIWNQHAYHGTNIREDAQVPVEQFPHWLAANGFRTNPAPNYAGMLCQPPLID
jgi:hypothetical protein